MTDKEKVLTPIVEWRGERSESRSHAGLAGSEQEGHDVRTPKL